MDNQNVITYLTGKVIRNIEISDNNCTIVFKGGDKLRIHDTAQQCCECRYMTCDDELDSFIGDKFVGVEKKSVGGNHEHIEYNAAISLDECHDVVFVDIITDRGRFQLVNHNEHNGYYAGFNVELQIVLDFGKRIVE